MPDAESMCEFASAESQRSVIFLPVELSESG